MPYSLDQALLLLQTTELTPQALTNLAKQVSIEAEGAVTVLYGGKLPDGSSAGDAITSMVRNGEDIRVIDKSAAGRFLSSDEFKTAAAKASGLSGADVAKFVEGTYSGTATNWLFSTDTTTSPWADASKRFAQATTGEVRLLASGADASRIFNQVELPTLLQKTDVTKIEGYTLDALKAMYPEAGGIPPNTSKILEGLKLASEKNIVFSGLTVSTAAGGIPSVNKGNFLTAELLDHTNYLGAHPEVNQAWANHLNAHPDKVPLFKTFGELHSTTAKALLKTGGAIASGIANKLGPIGIAIGFGLAANSASAATTDQEAKAIMRDWALDAAGSAAGEAFFGAIATIGIGVTVAAGVAISAPMAGAIILGAAIAGGFFGAEGATDFYNLLDDRDDNGKRDIIDKLSNLFFGATSTITTPLPADLNGDKFTIDASLSREEMVSKAKTDIAWRYALRELNSFVISDVSYTAHNTDGGLDLYNPATGQGSMTEAYLADRAAMLTWKLAFDKRNARDADDAVREGGASKPYNEEWDSNTVQGNWDFVDLGTRLPGGAPLTLAIDGLGLSLYDHQVVFGSKNADTIEGSGDTDKLYGMAGDDTLNGKGGNDYLEGGIGSDTYQFSGSWGKDTVVDAGGAGKIEVDGVTLSGGKKLSDKLWQSEDEKFRYVLQDNGDLIIQRSTGTDRITIKGWQDTQLGITLDGAPKPPKPAPVGPLNFNGDQRAKLIGTETQTSIPATDPRYGTYAWNETSWAADGTLNAGVKEDGFADVIYATAAGGSGAMMHGYGGNDALSGSAGKDDIYGDDGDDLIGGGGGSDNIVGGAGNDIIFGARVLQVNQRKKATDAFELPADGVAIRVGGPTWAEYVSSPRPGTSQNVISGVGAASDNADDVVDAGDGDDVVYGGGGADRLTLGVGDDWSVGGGGNDITLGGDGSDRLVGDGTTAAGYLSTTPGGIHGDDFLDGGAGNDAVIGDGANDLLFGGAGNDDVYGDSDRFSKLDNAYHGDDFLSGGAGADMLVGGGKSDTVLGGEGDDYLYGDDITEQNTMYALDGAIHGNDYLDGGTGNDKVVGGGGADLLMGGDGNDTLLGDGNALDAKFHGNDSLFGGAGDDTLFGDSGDDYLDGGSGTNYLIGGKGNDTYIAQEGDTIQDSEGKNTVHLKVNKADMSVVAGQSGLELTWNIAAGAPKKIVFTDGIFAGGTKLVFADGSESTLAKIASSTMSGMVSAQLNEKDATLFGGVDNDQLTSYGATSTVRGGRGNDQIFIGGDRSTIEYSIGDGIDTISGYGEETVVAIEGLTSFDDVRLEMNSLGEVYVRLADGATDKLRIYASPDQLSRFTLIDRFTLENGASLSFQDLLARGVKVVGNEGDDGYLAGSDLQDEIYAGLGNNFVYGGKGADTYRIEGTSNGSSSISL